ncbi:oxo-acid lyase [Peribacillus simplex]|uniref:Oxo-acid lyase n=1 Tax=Peribacillus simplex TaxID=1478 RepID=A0A8B5XXZ8_9BACI|nr:KDGP aldolase [Peribacillus simplex]TVX80041.1 oxo-acid lyase [Peribacillus simplex]
MTNKRVIFNVLAKDLENAKELYKIASEQILVGLMVKDFPSEEAAIETVLSFKSAGIPVSVGLGAGDPTVWKSVVSVSTKTVPDHVNQVFPASAYTLGALHQLDAKHTIVNALIEPSGVAGEVYITTGPKSKQIREKVSSELAATMLAEIGIHSVKFYPIDGDRRLDEVALMVRAAVKSGIKIFEPTGGINLSNVQVIVQTCLDNGAELVIPHLYTSIIDKKTGKTEVENLEKLLNIEWE